jgi:excisionase family DNA binding protein
MVATEALMITQTRPNEIEPAFMSIDEAARYTGESTWTVKNLLRIGVYRAKKAGRRTLIEFGSIKERTAKLPEAKFAPPRRRKIA